MEDITTDDKKEPENDNSQSTTSLDSGNSGSKNIGEAVQTELVGENAKPEEEDDKKPRDYKMLLRVYFIPIIAIFVFIFIILGLIFPKISDIFTDLEEVSSLQDELDRKQSELALLQSKEASVEELRRNLNVLNSLAPAGDTEVVQFQEKVEVLATQNALTINGQRLNDQANDAALADALELKQIPNDFELSGSKSNILQFIDELSRIADFVVVREMKFNGPANQEDWRLELTMVKYQFGDLNQFILATFDSVPIQTQVPQSIQDYIDSRISN